MLKYQTVKFKYGQFNVCRLYLHKIVEKLSEKVFQNFESYRALEPSILFPLVNVLLLANVCIKLMGEVLCECKSGQDD